MIIKWIREFPGHGRQEKRIYSGDAYNPPRRRRPSCGVLVRFRSVVFFSFLIYFSAVICLSDAVRPYNNNNIIHWHISVKSCARVIYMVVVVVVFILLLQLLFHRFSSSRYDPIFLAAFPSHHHITLGFFVTVTRFHLTQDRVLPRIRNRHHHTHFYTYIVLYRIGTPMVVDCRNFSFFTKFMLQSNGRTPSKV